MKTLVELKKALEEGRVSSVELTKEYLKAIESDRTNAFILPTPEHALAEAAASDRRRRSGQVPGRLEGLPLAVKDLFCTQGIQTTAASAILKGFIPAYESTVTANLWREGAVCLGKTNLDEFAMGSANITSHFGAVTNPLGKKDAPLAPGGSSGGSAAAVAAGLAPAATGSDTGGSIRQPAAFCGLVGAKPTYGVCSRYGMVAFASSLDQAGPITQTVEDAELMLKVMAGFDEKDSTSLKQEPDWQKPSLKGMKVGIPKEYRLAELPKEISELWQKAADRLADEGAEVSEVSLPHTRYALPAYYIVAPAEASSNLARYDGARYGLRVEGKDPDQMYRRTRGRGFGDEVTRRILIGAYVLSAGYYEAYYLKASKVRRRILEDFEKAFAEVDTLLAPTTPTAAFPLNEQQDFMTMYINDVLTVPASMAGMPAISVPCGQNGDGLPLGLQVIAPYLKEGRMLALAAALERLMGPVQRS